MRRFVTTTCALCAGLGACAREPAAEQQQAAPQAAVEALENREAPLPEAPLEVGAQVYDFNALVHTGQRINLSTFAKRPLVVYFCPNDRHPKCTELAVGVRDRWLELNAHIDMVLAVSSDDLFHHRDFTGEMELPHLFIPDPQGKVHRVFGLSLGVATSYLVDSERNVLAVLDVSSGAAHAAAILQVLGQLGKLGEPHPI